ncbi:MAG: AAA family ATPase, partial [Patescibacteria group bacterium]
NEESEIVKLISGVQALGYKPLETGFWGGRSPGKKFFGGSQWSNVRGVFRHKAKEIYEIHYRGGVIKTTGDHSVFVREKNMIKSKKASELTAGDTLVNLPFKVRSYFVKGLGTTHKVRAHEFPQEAELELDLFENRFQQQMADYQFVLANRMVKSQAVLAQAVGVSQATITNWQLGYNQPKFFSANVFSYQTPSKIKVSPDLMRLFGYYTAEGRTTDYYTQFVFGLHESDLHDDCCGLIKDAFGISATCNEVTESNSYRINVSSPIIAKFFEKHCGTGSHRKHLPTFIWNLPKEHFLAYLNGYSRGDGYITKDGKLSITSVSRQLIRELAWLCSMHGLQTGIREMYAPAGRIIKKGKPLPETRSWNLIIGKTSNPFIKTANSPNQWKKPIITQVIIKQFDGYVYDLCGCDGEAFFGGEKPILLHNSRVRDLFKRAKKEAPAIVFIDEIDAVGRRRGAGLGGSHDEREQTLNQILVEMDGFEPNAGVIVIAATNRPDVLDPALLRPGRFDRRVVIDLPDIKDREEILAVHAKNKPLAADVSIRKIAERTPGFSGADLANLLNEAAILTVRRNKKQVGEMEILESIEKVLLGPEKKSRVMSEEERKMTAYHEAGHAIVANFLPNCDPVRKVSIIGRGLAGGYTLSMPDKDVRYQTSAKFKDDLAMMLGGYIVEKMIYGNEQISTGPSSDLKKATQAVTSMVMRFGMSDKLGPRVYGNNEELIFLAQEIHEKKNYSEKTAETIDSEISRLLKEAEDKALRILTEHRPQMEALVKVLLEKETVEQEEFRKAVA